MRRENGSGIAREFIGSSPESSKEKEVTERARGRLKLYEAGKPYRE
jgi:hypothetical protein